MGHKILLLVKHKHIYVYGEYIFVYTSRFNQKAEHKQPIYK